MKTADLAKDDPRAYFRRGERQARALSNRGPIKFAPDGKLDEAILEAYGRCGFYIFTGVVDADELGDLQADLERVLERAPHTKDADGDARGRPALGAEFARPTFHFAKPLSDPFGGTAAGRGRHPAKMAEPAPPADAPDFILSSISGPLQIMDTCLRLYGHPQLLAIAEQINGADFTPFNEAVIVKPARLGASVAWHQDGTTHWDHPDLDDGTHGFNFMFQFYGSTAENGVWVLPGSHRRGKIDIAALVAANQGSDRLPGAVPMLCAPGDVVMANRQILHASFANLSPVRRATLNFGFHRRASVLGVVREQAYGGQVVYDEAYIRERSRMIALAIDARQQSFPSEQRYSYQPLAGREQAYGWSEETRAGVVKDYNLKDLGI